MQGLLLQHETWREWAQDQVRAALPLASMCSQPMETLATEAADAESLPGLQN